MRRYCVDCKTLRFLGSFHEGVIALSALSLTTPCYLSLGFFYPFSLFCSLLFELCS